MSNKFWDMFRAGNLSDDWRSNDPEQLSRARDLYHAFKKNRAEILEAGIFVEMILNAVLCDAIVGNDDEAREKLKSYVLGAEFCTYHQKWKMLRGLLKESNLWLGDYQVPGELVKTLKEVISARNNFAHGVLSVDASNSEVRLTYRNDGEKTDIITQSQIDLLLEQAEKVHGWLVDMHKTFNNQN